MPIHKILYFDLGAKTGVAWCEHAEGGPLSTYVDLTGGNPRAGRAQRLLALERYVVGRLTAFAPDFVAYEEPNVSALGTLRTIMSLVGYATVVEMACERHKFPHAAINASLVKSCALMKGDARRKALDLARAAIARSSPGRNIDKVTQGEIQKVAMMTAADAMGWTCRSPDEADALWGLHYVRDQIRTGRLKVYGP